MTGKNSGDLESIDEILGYMSFSKMRIGLSLINLSSGDKVLYLSCIFSKYGSNAPIIYDHGSDNQRIWYKWLQNVSKEDPFNYEEYEEDNYKYVFGLIDGSVQQIKYKGKNVKYMTSQFNYYDEDVELTLWALELKKEVKFDYNNLNFK